MERRALSEAPNSSTGTLRVLDQLPLQAPLEASTPTSVPYQKGRKSLPVLWNSISGKQLQQACYGMWKAPGIPGLPSLSPLHISQSVTFFSILQSRGRLPGVTGAKTPPALCRPSCLQIPEELGVFEKRRKRRRDVVCSGGGVE